MGKRTASAETLKPDPRFNSKLASKFINCLMWQGKKGTAQRIFYDALEQIKKRMPDVEPIEVFTQAVENVKPTVEVRLEARRRCDLPGADAGQQDPATKPVHPLDHRSGPRQGWPAHVPAPGRRTHGRLPPRGRSHDQARKHHQDGGVEQGLCSLRVVESIENPKSEPRNPKQIQNLKSQCSKPDQGFF